MDRIKPSLRSFFHFRLIPTCLTVVMLAGLISLGTWQVQRLHWKTQLLDTIDTRLHMSPVDITSITDTSEAAYRPVTASGLFQHDKELYLTAISLNGEGGYHVLTPLQLDDGRLLLVDRGWVPYDHKSPDTRQGGQLFGPVTIQGILRSPEQHGFHATNDPEHNIWYSLDLTAMATATHSTAFMPLVLEADATKNAGGYPIGGQTRITLPNNHFVYALTWYGLAVALLIIYGISSRRKSPR